MLNYDPINSAEEFVRLRQSEVQADYDRAARAEISEPVCLDVIARHPEMRQWIAHNKQVPMNVLALLAGDPDERVRFQVSMKRKLTLELLDRLSRDDDPGVRVSVARHPKVTTEIFDRLAADSDPWVREQVAERQQTR